MPFITFRPSKLQKQVRTIGSGGTSPLIAWVGANIALYVKNDTAGNPIATFNSGTPSQSDYLRMKAFNGTTIVENWLQVNGTVTNGGSYSAYPYTIVNGGTTHAFKAGTAVARYKYGPSGTIYMTSDDPNGPYMSFQTWATVPWTVVDQVRIGNLKNTFDYGASNVYGFTTGAYSASNTSIAVDSTNGIRIFNGTTKIGQWDTAGVITVGQVAASQNNILISSGAISIRNNTTERVGISAAGILTLKDSSGTAVITLDASANADINTKIRMAGSSSAIAIGSTPPTSAAAGTGIWLDRTGFYGLKTNTVQAKFDSNGVLTAGGGSVTMDATGLFLNDVTTNYAAGSSIKWVDAPSGVVTCDFYGMNNTVTGDIRQFLTVDSVAYAASASYNSYIEISSTSPSSKSSTVNIFPYSNGAATKPSLVLVSQNTGTPTNTATLSGSTVDLEPTTVLKIGGANVANGAIATAMSSVGPTGSHTTIQEWLKVTIGTNVRYIPMF